MGTNKIRWGEKRKKVTICTAKYCPWRRSNDIRCHQILVDRQRCPVYSWTYTTKI